MNGQEKQDELFKGANSAEYWMYDSRIGRRWEIDPIIYPWQSGYGTFNNNPIYFSDPLGLEGTDGDKGKGKSRAQKKLDNLNKAAKSGHYEYDENGVARYHKDGGDAPKSQAPSNTSPPDPAPDNNSDSKPSDIGKGVETNKQINRYKFFESASEGGRQSTVLGLKDMELGKPGKGEAIVRVDKPHPGNNNPHVNYNKKVSSVHQTPISSTAFKMANTTGKILKYTGKAAAPVIAVVDAKRIYDAVQESNGNMMSKKVVVVASDVAGGWAGAAAGAWAGAQTGMLLGSFGGPVGAAVGGFIGGLVGGIGGGIGGSAVGTKAAETYYKE